MQHESMTTNNYSKIIWTDLAKAAFSFDSASLEIRKLPPNTSNPQASNKLVQPNSAEQTKPPSVIQNGPDQSETKKNMDTLQPRLSFPSKRVKEKYISFQPAGKARKLQCLPQGDILANILKRDCTLPYHVHITQDQFPPSSSCCCVYDLERLLLFFHNARGHVRRGALDSRGPSSAAGSLYIVEGKCVLCPAMMQCGFWIFYRETKKITNKCECNILVN